MSRKARNPIILPKAVEAKVTNNVVMVKGPKGTQQLQVRDEINIKIAEGKIVVSLKDDSDAKNFLGLFWALIANMVKGVSEGFEKKLEMVGVGFRAGLVGKMLDLQIGFSHPTQVPIPEGIKVGVDKNTLVTISGADKQLVGQFAAVVRAKRPPEPYKGKGIRYVDEYVRKKAGKAGKAAKK